MMSGHSHIILIDIYLAITPHADSINTDGLDVSIPRQTKQAFFTHNLWVTMDQRVHNIVLNEFLSAG